MATIFNALADRIYRTASIPDYNAAYTWMFWAKIVTDTDNFQWLATLNDDSGSLQHDSASLISDGVTERLSANGPFQADVGTTLVVGTWYHLCIIRSSASSAKLYLDTVLDAELTNDYTGRAASARMEMAGYEQLGDFRFDGKLAYARFWTKDIGAANIATERASTTAIDTVSLYGDWPLISNILDVSGSAHHWTEGGALTFDADTPIAVSSGHSLVIDDRLSNRILEGFIIR